MSPNPTIPIFMLLLILYIIPQPQYSYENRKLSFLFLLFAIFQTLHQNHEFHYLRVDGCYR